MIIGALLAGPIGMQANLYAVKYIGSSFSFICVGYLPSDFGFIGLLHFEAKISKNTVYLRIVLIIAGIIAQDL